MSTVEVVVAIIVAIFGSGGFWTFLQCRREKKSALNAMVLGLGFSRLSEECKKYLDRGVITIKEFDSLTKYLFEPYKAMGGNGVAEALYDEVREILDRKA